MKTFKILTLAVFALSPLFLSTVSNAQQGIDGLDEEDRKMLREFNESMREYAKPQSKIVLPVPPFPVAESGQYSTDVKRAGELLREKNLANFYWKTKIVLQKIYHDEGIRLGQTTLRLPGPERYSKDELVGLEWLYYYLASSPLERNDGSEWSNLETKLIVAHRLSKENAIKTADFLSVDGKLFQERHCAYMLAVLGTLNNSITIAKESIEKIEKRELELKNHLLSRRMTTEKKIEVYKFLEERSRSTHATLSLFERTAISGHREIEINGDGYVKIIIKTFPGNGEKIRDSLRKSGFGSDFEVACLLQRYVGRDKENAYLYRGLPSQKEIDEVFNEKKKRIETEKAKEEALRSQEVEE
jgi:hypothetical protein